MWKKKVIITKLSFQNVPHYEISGFGFQHYGTTVFSYICFPHFALSFLEMLFTFLRGEDA